ncbi:MAG: right-handed parallel beta-helix repeat-containing protein [Phycisphaerae bacterium]|nr:right-handed parallel beta-helix repeat-containing protein [Phycisphaerae bacterium]
MTFAFRLATLVIVLGGVMLTETSAPAQVTWHVDDDAPLGGDGQSWPTAFRYLQDALAAAASGDQIRVAAGLYTPDRDEAGLVTPGNRDATFQMVDGVELIGGYRGCPGGTCGGGDPDERNIAVYETILSGDLAANDIPDLAAGLNCFTVLYVGPDPGCEAFDLDEDGDVDRNDLGTTENSNHVVMGSGVSPTAVLDGFAVTAGSGEYTRGAGMQNLMGDPTMRNCLFLANYDGGDGGGVFNSGSSPMFVNCTFHANRSGSNGGGGMENEDGSNPLILGCRFVANWANSGGAIGNLHASARIVNSVFLGNRCTWSWGGAIWNLYADSVPITNCIFSGNTSQSGGALYNVHSNITMTNCTIVNNHIGDYNWGGGIRQSNGTLVVVNSILWGNWDSGGTDESAQLRMTDATPVVRYSCIRGCTTFCSVPGNGNTGDDPLFFDADGPDDLPGTEDDNLGLAPESRCIDAGDNDAVAPDTFDLDGDLNTTEPIPFDVWAVSRFIDVPDAPDTGNPGAPGPPIVDMGAHESGGDDCNHNGVPDEMELDYDGDSWIDACDRDDDGDAVPDSEDACPFGEPGEPAGPDGQPLGDWNADCVVDVSDYTVLAVCLVISGPSTPPPYIACSPVYDFDRDSDVDLEDFGAFQRQFASP